MPAIAGQVYFIIDRETDNAKFLTHDAQDLIRNVIKTAQRNTATELITNVQDLRARKLIPSLKILLPVSFATNASNFLLWFVSP